VPWFSRRLSATAVRFVGILLPPGIPPPWAYQSTGLCPCWTMTGYPRSARVRYDRVRAPPLPRDHGAHAAGSCSPAAIAASQRQVLNPACHIPSRRAPHHEASSEVYVLRPSGLPLACGFRMERLPLGFSSELRTPQRETATHVGVGTGFEH